MKTTFCLSFYQLSHFLQRKVANSAEILNQVSNAKLLIISKYSIDTGHQKKLSVKTTAPSNSISRFFFCEVGTILFFSVFAFLEILEHFNTYDSVDSILARARKSSFFLAKSFVRSFQLFLVSQMCSFSQILHLLWDIIFNNQLLHINFVSILIYYYSFYELL